MTASNAHRVGRHPQPIAGACELTSIRLAAARRGFPAVIQRHGGVWAEGAVNPEGGAAKT